MDDPQLHTIEPIVTHDRFEYGLHRVRVPGGWIYWLNPGYGPVSSFVPSPPPSTEVALLPKSISAEMPSIAVKDLVRDLLMNCKISPNQARILLGVSAPPADLFGQDTAAETGADLLKVEDAPDHAVPQKPEVQPQPSPADGPLSAEGQEQESQDQQSTAGEA